MADNTVLSAGSGGDTISTDDIAGVKVQRVKVQYGVDGVATDVSDTDPLPIDDAGGSLTVDNAALSVVGAGTEAAAQRVTIASDSSGVISVDDNGSTLSIDDGAGSITVDGTVTANLAAGTNNIGDVDVLSVPAPLSTTGGGTEATALRVTVANNSTGVLSVDDNGASLTVDVGTALPAGTNAIGKLAANSGVDIGDVDVLSIAAGTNTIGAVNVKPTTSGGLTPFRSIDLDETEEEIKATAGQVFGWYLFNAAATTRYVKFYNATAANVTVGTTTPFLTIPVPAGAAANVEFTNGIAFTTAITVAATTGVADADVGAPAANDVIANVLYA